MCLCDVVVHRCQSIAYCQSLQHRNLSLSLSLSLILQTVSTEQMLLSLSTGVVETSKVVFVTPPRRSYAIVVVCLPVCHSVRRITEKVIGRFH